MRILVTGGAGFIASHIVDAYIADGHEVSVVDNLSSGRKEFINKKAKFYQADIRNTEEIKTIIQKVRPEVINHHAAQISVRTSVDHPSLDLEINLGGLLNLLIPGKDAGLNKFIFASSGGVVYGEVNVIPTPETYTPLMPQSPYGITKLASEYYLNFFRQTYGIPFIALRYANVYGPRQNPHGEAGVVAIFSRKLLRREIPTINGDGKQTRDYVYVGDIVTANKKALNSREVGAFNIGTGKETDVNELYSLLKSLTSTNIAVKYGPARLGEQKRSCLNCKLAREKLKWQPVTNLSDGLKKTVEYFAKYEK